ncbi:MAG TPA: hypothetical protein VIK60_18560 [Vicinamibacterales bacterium]
MPALGFLTLLRALLAYIRDHVSADGAWWILGLNGTLLIPLIFSVFFYPTEVLIGVGVAFVLTVAALVVNRIVRTRLHRARVNQSRSLVSGL